MEQTSAQHTLVRRRVGIRSLAKRYSAFTGLLLVYLLFIFFAYDYWAGHFSLLKVAVLSVCGLGALGGIARFTSRLLAKPLMMLQEGITAVQHGRLEEIQVSRTGDEIEFLGESFNAMIRALDRSHQEIQQHQESLEERIRQRTSQLEKASRRAEAASQSKSEFLANMSHELRTPMSGVMGMLDIVLDSRLDHEQRDYLVTAKSCAASLLALLNDILDLSKIEAGKMVLEAIPYEVRSVVTECVKTIKPRVHGKIALEWTVADDVPARVLGDPLRVSQILSNLLSNAVKFTAQGKVTLRVALAQGGRELVYEVEDSGIGIVKAQLPTIFEEFTQADGSISRRYGGTGLGLAITRRLVEMHRGRITVESEVGRGSTFRVVLPVTRFSEIGAAAGGTAATREMAEHPAEDPRKPAILVVEDNLVNQKVVTMILRRHGYEVDIANHGGEVLAALERRPASLILMDVQMPVVDGIEATRLVRDHRRFGGTPIIAMTAHAMTGDRDMCLEAGMDAYISKPINRHQLVAAIDEILSPQERPLESAAVTSLR